MRISLVAGLLVLLLTGSGVLGADEIWQELEPGLDLGRFDTQTQDVTVEAADLVVLRVDPAAWELKVLTCPEQKVERGLEAWDWCRRFGLVAAINAGMYQADHRTHVGYCKIDGQVVNPGTNDYLSAAAMDPVDPADPVFRIFDLDEIALGEVAARYRTVVQNLRLIKRPGDNRWQNSRENWREAALGEDYKGRALLIYCHSKLPMHEFNTILLSLPLGLVAAQHLEGSGPANLWIDHPGVAELNLPGGKRSGLPLPNILGVAPRHPQASE